MLKHPEITLRRLKLFLQTEIKERIYGARYPLFVATAETADGEFTTIEPGFKWGPAYNTRWFKVHGEVPQELEGKSFRIIADVGGERTIWKDGSPILGVDVEHSDFGFLQGGAVSVSDELARAGDRIELMIEAYAGNPQMRVHGKEPPREALVEEVKGAWLVEFDWGLQQLRWEWEFMLGVLESLDPADPQYSKLLRVMNGGINHYRGWDIAAAYELLELLEQTRGQWVGSQDHTIHAVGHSHLDTAWLWPISITKKKMAHTTATQLELIERYPWYVFAHSQAAQYEWLELEYPALFERVEAAIKKGQWEPVGSMWVEADCNIPSGESLVRQFLYGRKYFREKLGVETEDMFLPDVFGYSAALPQILAGFGIKYFLTQKISWNQFNKFPHNTFWWKGIDGTRVWSHFPPADTYVGNCEPAELLKSVKQHKDHGRSDQSLYLYGFGDGGGGPTERHLELLDRASNCGLMPKIVKGGKVVDFYRDAYDRSRDLATWTGELYLELHRGTYTTQAANKKANRECEFLLRDAEMLSAFAFEGDDYPVAELEKAWKLLLLNQFHDIIPGSSVREVYEDSAKDYEEIRGICAGIIDLALTVFAASFATAALGKPALAFSGCPEAGGGPEIRLVDFSTATQKDERQASGNAIEDGEWRVEFDDSGSIVSIKSPRDGQEFIAEGQRANMFQLMEDKPLFWSAWDVDPFAYETVRDLLPPDSFEIVSSTSAKLVRSFGSSRITQTISLGAGLGIRFETEIDWHEEDKLLKVAFPVAINSDRATYEIQFGHVERPTHYNTSWDIARFEVCAQKWVDISEGGRGVALLNDGKYGHDIHDGVIRLTLLRSPKAPDPHCDMGLHRFTYVLMPHEGTFQDAGVVRAAYALNSPVRHLKLGEAPSPASGTVDCAHPISLISVDTPDLIIEAVKRAEDGNGIIVRLYECHNRRGSATLRCFKSIAGASRCNLEEVEQWSLEVSSDGSVALDYRPFEIITVRLR